MPTTSLCDRAKAILNLDQTCEISKSVAALGNELPAHLDGISSAAQTLHENLNVAPLWVEQKVHEPAMDLARKVQGYTKQARALAEVPLKATEDDFQRLRGYADRAGRTARNVAGLINSINCVARVFTDHAIPGARKAAHCMDDIGNQIRDAVHVADQIRQDWARITEDSISFITNNIDKLVQEGIKSNGFTECLAGLAHIPPNIVSDVTGRMGQYKISTGSLGKQLGGCAGRARDSANKMRDGAKQLRSIANDVRDQRTEASSLVSDVASLTADLQTKDKASALRIEEIISGADVFPGTPEKLEVVADQADTTADALELAANAMDLATLSFTYGHDIMMDRIGNFIRIMHKDGHYTLYNATNIIHAADVTNKHLLWLENAITKFNSHTHLYNPGPGAPTPTRTPIPIFDMTDGTSITKAG